MLQELGFSERSHTNEVGPPRLMFGGKVCEARVSLGKGREDGSQEVLKQEPTSGGTPGELIERCEGVSASSWRSKVDVLEIRPTTLGSEQEHQISFAVVAIHRGSKEILQV